MRLTDPALAAILDREHAAARAQRGQPRPPQGDMADFRTSEMHRTRYLSIRPDQGRWLYALAVGSGARQIVEFGTSFGISTLYLAAAADETGGMVTGSEFHPEKAARARQNLSEAGLVADIRVGDARQTLADPDGPIDLLFLDGAKDLYVPVLEMLTPRLAPRALVVADNIDPERAEIAGFLDSVAAPGYVTSLLGFGKGGMSLSLRMA
ncbi:methyltransferase domain-containing protein [Mesobaculum littorinae]|uniref:Methyltransferase domain-containing protein n=1 Tax=Mesobaculum littorinae TaxID=2486419 RepID=A0A438AFW3_9RHOB|nr:class I SAM-dependent methyltransferase [Mesobaculum littorinae]RVV97584.1 methyltransferase domain-containing protein [Mesobaculum littorinae]